eukprot:m.251962 g.251962  ORF g.251962 m.251962 type:complete len:60 (-) comp16153_c2_seq5:143-322(-)
MNMTSIRELPIEILAHIFKFVVSEPGMIATLLQVCTQWTVALSVICKDHDDMDCIQAVV